MKVVRDSYRRIRGEVRSLWAAEVCPFCFETFRLKETPFRCASPPQICAPELDTVLKDRWKDSRRIGRVLPAEDHFALHRNCPNCRERSYKRLCPRCHQELPHTFADYRNYIFALIGAKGSGKSNYLPVLIEQLKKQVGPQMNMLLQPMNDFTIDRYRDAFYDPLFREHKAVETTQSALSVAENQFPMTFSLTFSGKKVTGSDTIKRTITLAFFDTAGEDLKAEDTMNAVNKYIYRSDGVILLLDPLQLNSVRDRLAGTTDLPPQDIETSDIVTRVTKLIRLGRGLDIKARIPTPIAITLSKLDAIERLLGPQLQLLSTTRHGPKFDKPDFDAVDAEVRGLVSEWDSEYLVQQVTTQFKYYGFFALSALGGQPEGGTDVKRIIPRRAEDPFLWLLHHHGLIKASK